MKEPSLKVANTAKEFTTTLTVISTTANGKEIRKMDRVSTLTHVYFYE